MKTVAGDSMVKTLVDEQCQKTLGLSSDQISTVLTELLQQGKPLEPKEPWASAENIGSW